MKTALTICFWACSFAITLAQPAHRNAQGIGQVDLRFFGKTLSVFPLEKGTPSLTRPLQTARIAEYNLQLDQAGMLSIAEQLRAFRQKEKLNDWFYYQLVRRVAQFYSPKESDFEQYTLLKAYLMDASGYDALVAISDRRLLLYIQSDEDVAGIPLIMVGGRQYICLNRHDFYDWDAKLVVMDLPGKNQDAAKSFSYKIDRIPEADQGQTENKELTFQYKEEEMRFSIRINPEMSGMFQNYPCVDFSTYFNIPMSRMTYESLLPVLRKKLKHKSTQQGVEYLMQFTRYALPYEDDQVQFGKEKRLSPELTLAYGYSDCDDRAALFYYLVKELYDLPMIALRYPDHLTMGVALKNAKGQTIAYNGKVYTICEPTPQREDLPLGELPSSVKAMPYEVVYAYTPVR